MIPITELTAGITEQKTRITGDGSLIDGITVSSTTGRTVIASGNIGNGETRITHASATTRGSVTTNASIRDSERVYRNDHDADDRSRTYARTRDGDKDRHQAERDRHQAHNRDHDKHEKDDHDRDRDRR
jgi:hypothetical protein